MRRMGNDSLKPTSSRRRWLMITLVTLPFAGLRAQGVARRSGMVPAAVDSVLARGIAIDLALSFASLRNLKARAQFERSAFESGFELQQTLEGRWLPPGLQAWVGFPRGADHWHRYTVAEVDGRVFRLGGFQAPELLALDRALGHDADGLQRRAAVLAALADPHGAERFVVSDTITMPLGLVGTMVSLSTASFEPNSYAAHWEGFRYAFLFSSTGELAEWSREELQDVKAPVALPPAP